MPELNSPAIALWQQLQATATVLLAVRAGQATTASLDKVAPALRPGVQALTFQVLRSLGRAQALRQHLASRAPPPAADALLCTALALAWRDSDAPYEAFTLVNQTIEAAKRDKATQPQANFINACLRRFLREKEALVATTDNDPLARWNHPAWWIARLKKDYPAQWQTILQANLAQAPMTLRVNRLQSSRDDYLHQLAAAGIAATATGAFGVTLEKARPVQDIPGFAHGVVSVQDAAAQLAAPLLLEGMRTANTTAPLRVLDACAAPGGKTAHLLEFAPCEVTALEIDSQRAERIHQNLQRLGLSAKIIVGDAARPQDWWDGQLFDAILLDAPCTASGIVRRHPDVPWLRRETDVGDLGVIQARLLQTLWPLLKPAGRLLYCTCSVFKAEGADPLQTFLVRNTDATLRPSPGHLVPHFRANQESVPDNSADDHDGFYLALLEKSAA
jgi:16S rRNA (cytosine967-C5)-methyltransferase